MLELYDNINSVCAQKIRLALAEKRLPWTQHLMKLGGDQFTPEYLALNPNGVVPTLVHDGTVVIESSVILYYLDDAFPEMPLMPKSPVLRARVRMVNKLIDEYVHDSCTTLTFATAFRPRFLTLTREQIENRLMRSPSAKRIELKRDVILHGLDSRFIKDAVEHHEKLLTLMEAALKEGPYIAGDAYSLADIAALPYVLRLELLGLAPMWDKRPAVTAWWDRVKARASTQAEIFARMTEADSAFFKDLNPAPWNKVQELV